MIERGDVQTLIDLALAEDVGSGDLTTRAIFSPEAQSNAHIVAKDSGIFCGAFMAGYVYASLSPRVKCASKVEEGAPVQKGDTVMTFEGPTVSLLEGERVALNFLQRMCAIATRSSVFAAIVAGSTITILDTRKTLPGFRMLDKYAVACGGGKNHRMGLYDMVMIKDNHIKAAGSITKAVAAVRERYAHSFKIEVEATTVSEVSEALYSGADIIMLDNMDRKTMEESIEIIGGRAKTEISGNMTEEKITALKDLRVDYISIGALTHSVSAFDLSMKFE